LLKHLTSLRAHLSRRSLAQGIVEYGAAIAVAMAAVEAVSELGDEASDLFNAVGSALEQSVTVPASESPFAP
jgi:Flp pilus assembly pilin Flp